MAIKQLRYYFRFGQTFILKRKKIIILGMIVGILFFYFYPKIKFILLKEPNKIGLVGRFTTEEFPLDIQNLISSGLTQLDPDGQAKPALASSWEIKDEGKVYNFILKENLFWQNGTPLTARDVNYNFSDVAVSVINDRSIEFRLKEPFSPFSTIMAKPIFKKGLTGTGDYWVKSISKNGDYLEKIVLKSKKSSLPTLIYRIYPTEEAAKIAFISGEINTLEKISDLKDFSGWPKVTIESSVEKNQYAAIFFNTQDENLNDKSLRQALAYAIKKPWQNRALSPINSSSWAYNQDVKPYKYDLENAKNLLKKFQQDKEGDQSIKIELSTVPFLLSTAEEITRDWKELGIDTSLKVINSISKDYQALLIIQEIPADPDQYTLWHSTQTTNLSSYKNPKIDKLLEDGRKTQELQKRKEIYFDFQKFIVEETPAVFLYHPILYTARRS